MGSDTNLSADIAESLDRHRDSDGTGSGTVMLDEDRGYVGDTVTIRGRNLPADTTFDVNWHTVDGDWGVLQSNRIIGPQYSPRNIDITSVTTDADGTFDERFEIPTDYGGSHTIALEDQSGSTVAQTEIEIRQFFEIEETEAELGDFFTVRGYGIGPNPVMNNYQVAWDNAAVGFMTGVMNRGTATARVRAVGPPGKHELRIWRSYRGWPFLQTETQSPYGPVGDDRQSKWTVEVTEPENPPETAWSDPLLNEEPLPAHYPDIDEQTDATLEVTPSCGPPGTSGFIKGRHFPPNETVDLVWYTHEGKRIEGSAITPAPRRDVLPTVESDENGEFQVEFEAPIDRGATRAITAEIGGKSVTVSGFMLQPQAINITPTQVAPGEEFEVEIHAVGWTLYENTIFFVVDNKVLGYVCGNTSDDEPGVIRTKLTAPYEPGWHFIDVYPAIFEQGDDEPDFECKPHLSYLDNHPVRPLPAHHFAFEVVE
ncbi:MAG: hypothetical protein ABEJ84_03910 [Halodesulfurarchaeum sp.]